MGDRYINQEINSHVNRRPEFDNEMQSGDIVASGPESNLGSDPFVPVCTVLMPFVQNIKVWHRVRQKERFIPSYLATLPLIYHCSL